MNRPVNTKAAGLSPPSPAERQSIARDQFQILGDVLNQRTFRHIRALKIGAGWRCWEAGAGAGGVPSWLAEQVGPAGYVLASDIDVSVLAETPDRSFEVRRHDLTVDAPPACGEFDLVHARLVLEHLSDSAFALTAMASSLRRGGWLLLESSDPRLQPLACPDESGPKHALANKLRNAMWDLMAQRTHLSFGRTLPRLLRERGLADVNAEVTFDIGGSDARHLQRTLITHARPALIASGLASADEIDPHLADLESADLDIAVFPIVSAWGRKPSRRDTP
ncbi:MAG TPA: methyltransferase domain-containing protein [Mycobacterium sp.]|nr:methyltransferase domain-containing protein [Mycobacterium sp.]